MLGGKHVLHERSYSVGALIAQSPLLRSRPYCAGARIAKEPPILSYGPFVRMFRPRCCAIIRCGCIFLSSAPHKLAEVRQSRNFSKFLRCTRHVFEPLAWSRLLPWRLLMCSALVRRRIATHVLWGVANVRA